MNQSASKCEHEWLYVDAQTSICRSCPQVKWTASSLAPAAAPCANYQYYEINSDLCGRCGMSLLAHKPRAGRWRPCTERPKRTGIRYKRKDFDGEPLHEQIWGGDVWCNPVSYAASGHQLGWWLDPGSQGDEQGAAQDSAVLASHSVQECQPEPVAAHQERRSAGSESNAATSAKCTDAEAVAGGAARHAGSIPAHSAHQELAALRAECRRVIGTYTRVAKFGERE